MPSRDEEELRILRQELVSMMASMIGPTGDLLRASINARVDALIEARRSFVTAGWDEWLLVPVMVALAGGNPSFGKSK